MGEVRALAVRAERCLLRWRTRRGHDGSDRTSRQRRRPLRFGMASADRLDAAASRDPWGMSAATGPDRLAAPAFGSEGVTRLHWVKAGAVAM